MATTLRWLFIDFDNTMMGTEELIVPSIVERFNELYGAQCKEPLTFESFKQNFHGMARETLCQALSRHFKVDVDYPLLYEDREWRMMQLLQRSGVEMAAGIIETLHALSEAEVQLAFVSNNPIQRALCAMRFATNKRGDELARLFGTRYFEAGDKQKPSPDVYLRAMAQLGADALHSMAVEDSSSGVKAAVAAGLRTLGFLGFARDEADAAALEDKLLGAGAYKCIKSWPDFLI